MGDGHAVQDGVDAPVAAPVEAMPGGWAVALGGRRGQGGGAVEAGEAALSGEAPGVAHLDEQFGVGTFRDADKPRQCRAGGVDEASQLGDDLVLPPVELGDVGPVGLEQGETGCGGDVARRGPVQVGKPGQSLPDVGGVGQLGSDLLGQGDQQRLGLVEQVLAALEDARAEGDTSEQRHPCGVGSEMSQPSVRPRPYEVRIGPRREPDHMQPGRRQGDKYPQRKGLSTPFPPDPPSPAITTTSPHPHGCWSNTGI